MNMYVHELRSLRKNTAVWTCSIIAVAALYLLLFPSIQKDADAFRQMLSGYPPSVLAMFGASLDSITSLLGFYSMVITFVVLCGAVQAMNLGLSVLSKESRERTADFLLVKPVSRVSIVSAKLLAGLTMIAATDVVYFAAAILLANAASPDYRFDLFTLLNLQLLFVQLIFFALGVVISVFFGKLRSVLPISLGVVFGFYIFGALLAAKEDDVARYFSPFRYFSSTYIIQSGHYELPYLITGAAIVAVSVAAGYFIYGRKDIHAVN